MFVLITCYTAGILSTRLGIVSLANTGPQALAPAVAGGVITYLGGYTVLYLLAGGCALLAAVLIQPVCGVR